MRANLFPRHVRRQLKVRPRPEFALLFLLLAPAWSNAVDLQPETVRAWEAYILAAKARMQERAIGHRPYLWVNENRDLLERVRAGEVLVEAADGGSPHPVPGGLIHDWIGTVFIPNARLDDVMGVLDDYAHYKDFYHPMVVKSQLLERAPDHEKVTLVMVGKAHAVTGAVETDDVVQIARLGADRVYSVSNSVRVQAIADYGQSSEHMLPEDQGPGYVWRTFGVTRLEQHDGGVYVEMEMTDLSRTIPWEFRWLVQPLAEHLAQNMLVTTLQETRDAVTRAIKASSLRTQSMSR